MVYDAQTGLAYLYGESQVNYQDMQLTAAEISMSLDSSLVHANGGGYGRKTDWRAGVHPRL